MTVDDLVRAAFAYPDLASEHEAEIAARMLAFRHAEVGMPRARAGMRDGQPLGLVGKWPTWSTYADRTLKPTQAEALAVLRDAPGPMTARAVAAALPDRKRQTITDCVRYFKAREQIAEAGQIQPAPGTFPATTYGITDAGRAALEAAEPGR